MIFRVKNPGWPLVFYSPLWSLAGLYIGGLSIARQSYVLGAVWISMGLLAALIFLDWRWVAWPLVAYFCFALIGGVVLLASSGVTFILVLRLAIVSLFIYELVKWGLRRDAGLV